MNKERIPQGILPSFEMMTDLNDESIADVLTWLIAFVEAFEDHYADPSHDGAWHVMKNFISRTMTSKCVCRLTLRSMSYFERSEP